MYHHEPCRVAGVHPASRSQASSQASSQAGSPSRFRRRSPPSFQPRETGEPVGPPLTLHRLLIPAPQRTVLLRVSGDSMQGLHIHHGDLLVVERQAHPRNGQVVVALLADGVTVKQLVLHQGRWRLQAAHPAYPCLELAEGELWGVATHVIRPLLPAGRGGTP